MTTCWLHGPMDITWCVTKCRAWSKDAGECEFVLAARELTKFLRRLRNAPPRHPMPPEAL